VAERMQRLLAVVEPDALRKHEGRISRIEPVLIEGPSKKNAAMMSARTEQNKLVHFAAADGATAGAYAEVLITSAAPHFLRGDLVRVTAPARRARTRIPVASI
jgi:tRNA-2-methylthio-N6-dimethylallyladenosine synthase